MSPEIERQVNLEKAQRDLRQIKALRESEAFNQYFVRRLNDRHDEHAKEFKYGTISHEEREIRRRLVLELEYIAELMAKDESSAMALIASQVPKPPEMPGLSGFV